MQAGKGKDHKYPKSHASGAVFLNVVEAVSWLLPQNIEHFMIIMIIFISVISWRQPDKAEFERFLPQ